MWARATATVHPLGSRTASMSASRQPTSLRSRSVWMRLLSAKAGDTGIGHLWSYGDSADRSPLCQLPREAVAVAVLRLPQEEHPVLLPVPLVDPDGTQVEAAPVQLRPHGIEV